ncbi:hypothetical protein PYCCODRAFT_1437844 [Trametes coccinea BRFM310]|uniref:Uncharacterized protein n=1 Tax=Trametes coccinea (strain BRFM310) TaxID=1353009 RepID=A0A1Y2IGW0_TRAC3|nr:hypothetical protein PYCCODRAFT_1437844 [Trametes coccinea BRFM310]
MGNWTSYQTAVETFLRLKGLEAHLAATDQAFESDEKGTERRQWEADDELARAVIILNIRGAHPEWLEKACTEQGGAAVLWIQIKDNRVKGGNEQKAELGVLKQQKRREDKDEQWMTALLMFMGAMVFVSIIKA